MKQYNRVAVMRLQCFFLGELKTHRFTSPCNSLVRYVETHLMIFAVSHIIGLILFYVSPNHLKPMGHGTIASSIGEAEA